MTPIPATFQIFTQYSGYDTDQDRADQLHGMILDYEKKLAKHPDRHVEAQRDAACCELGKIEFRAKQFETMIEQVQAIMAMHASVDDCEARGNPVFPMQLEGRYWEKYEERCNVPFAIDTILEFKGAFIMRDDLDADHYVLWTRTGDPELGVTIGHSTVGIYFSQHFPFSTGTYEALKTLFEAVKPECLCMETALTFGQPENDGGFLLKIEKECLTTPEHIQGAIDVLSLHYKPGDDIAMPDHWFWHKSGPDHFRENCKMLMLDPNDSASHVYFLHDNEGSPVMALGVHDGRVKSAQMEPSLLVDNVLFNRFRFLIQLAIPDILDDSPGVVH